MTTHNIHMCELTIHTFNSDNISTKKSYIIKDSLNNINEWLEKIYNNPSQNEINLLKNYQIHYISKRINCPYNNYIEIAPFNNINQIDFTATIYYSHYNNDNWKTKCITYDSYIFNNYENINFDDNFDDIINNIETISIENFNKIFY